MTLQDHIVLRVLVCAFTMITVVTLWGIHGTFAPWTAPSGSQPAFTCVQNPTVVATVPVCQP